MAVKGSNYWKDRMKALENEQYQRSAEYYKDVQEQFSRASNNIQMDIEHWYYRLAENNEVSYASAKKLLKGNELEEFKWSVEEYIKAGKENEINQKWMKQLENASAKYHISRLGAMKIQAQQHVELLFTEYEGGIAGFLKSSLERQYYHTAYEVAKGTGIGTRLEKLDTDKIDILIKRPWAQDGTGFSDRIWENKEKLVQNLHTELSQCIIRGASPQQAIDNLAKTMNASKGAAGNLIMTESASISSISQRKCFVDLGVKEFEVVETLDTGTCGICQDMDGEHFPMSDFEIGITAPPFHPRCRGCICPYFNDEFTEGEERAARDLETGKTHYVPSNMTYKKWYKEFVADRSGKEYTMSINLPEAVSSIKGFTPKVKEDIENAVSDMQNEYEININSIVVEEAAKGDIFVTGYHDGKMDMVINQNADFNKILAIIPARHESGYMAGKTIQDYVAHEMFHVMLYQDCTSNYMYNARYMQIESLYDNLKGISGYADSRKSGNEALAEAFVRLRNGDEIPLIAKVLIESYIGKWKK